MRVLHLTIFMYFLSIHHGSAQKFDLGSWNVINAKYNLDKKWSLFGEGQLRSLHFYRDFHYYEYKAGVSCKMHKNIHLTLGAGSYQTYREGGTFVLPKNNDELRVWPQVIFLQSISRLNIEQRYRAEFRFTSNGYRNRFRYRLGFSYVFGKERNAYKPFQISASNEIFFTDKEAYFERNRLLFTFSYKTSPFTTVQIGYVHQFDYKINDETGRDFFLIGYFFEFFQKKATNTSVDFDIKDN